MTSFLEPLFSLFRGAEVQPFQEAWVPGLEKSFPIYGKLPDELREKLHIQVAQFMATKHFTACNGLELTEEMIVLISAQACLLTLNQEGAPYPRLTTILIYPSTFTSIQESVDAYGVVSEKAVHRLGESWDKGSVVLAWDSTKGGAKNPHDGHNVSIHEFAHQLDQEDGAADGAPACGLSRNELRIWCTVMQSAYTKFLSKIKRKQKTVIDRYGATNPAEFFAVLTETFFEKPKQLHQRWPDLYELMKSFYNLDPLEWK